MTKNFISLRQFVCLSILFIFGSSVVMGINVDAGNNSWISLGFSCIIIIPLLFLWGRLSKIHEGKNIFQMFLMAFGKKLGKVFVLLFMFYCLHLSGLVLRNFSEYIKVAVMPETPQILTLLFIITPVIYLAKSGMQTLGKWGAVCTAVVTGVLLLTILASINIFKPEYLLPIDKPVTMLMNSGMKMSAFPFGEMVIFLAIGDAVRTKGKENKAFFLGAYISAILLLMVLLRNVMTLGTFMQKTYFPSFIQAKIIKVSESLERIEGLIAFNFILAGITKITITVVSLAKGLAVLLDVDDYKKFTTPMSFVSLALAVILYNNLMEMFEFIKFYHYYAVIFQVIIPLVLLIVSEIRRPRSNSAKSNNAKDNADLSQATTDIAETPMVNTSS